METAAMSTRPRGHLRTAGLAYRERAASGFPEIRFRVDFDDRCSVGVGKVQLLEAVEQTGSLSQAARKLAMSYRRAWLLIDSMNVEFDTPVISASVGGRGGGGAKLTRFGKELMEAYRSLEIRLAPLTTECMSRIAAHVVRRSRRSATGPIPRKTIARSLKRGFS